MGRGRGGESGKGSASFSAETNLGRRLRNMEARLDTLDNAIQEVDAEYSGPILQRMHEIEEKCRSHANSVFDILRLHAARLDKATANAVEDVAKVTQQCQKMDESARRYREESGAMRSELGTLRQMIDQQSMTCSGYLQQIQEVVAEGLRTYGKQRELQSSIDEQFERLSALETAAQQLQSPVLDSLRFQSFALGQRQVIEQARSRSASMPVLIRQARQVARSRSPSTDSAASGGHRYRQDRFRREEAHLQSLSPAAAPDLASSVLGALRLR